MNYEKAYRDALERARNYYKGLAPCRAKDELELIFPELRESEDERIRRKLIGALKLKKEEGKEFFGSEPIKNCIAYLEKQKEPENVSASTMAPSCWAEEPSLQKEQKPAECIEDSVKFEEGFKAGRESGLRDGQKYVLNNLDSYGLCKPAEWSEEDELMRTAVIQTLERFGGRGTTGMQIDWLRTLRPSWKPSEEQMKALCDALRVSLCEPDMQIPYEPLSALYEQLKKL